jgi:GH25 family lysozyme M1 (1,4-beta-N-acetylmuramidase)
MENNIDIGIYFFTQAVNYEEGVEEAEFVLSNIADIDVKYPIVIDTEEMEADNARANGISNSDRTDAIVGFCETIKAAGYTPMIYANRNWYAESLDMDRLGDYGLWLAQYSNVPDFPYMFSAWQYTPYGSVPGITGDVDLNIWIE